VILVAWVVNPVAWVVSPVARIVNPVARVVSPVARIVNLVVWVLIQPVEAFVAEPVIMPVTAVDDMVDDGIEVIGHLYIPKDAMYETVKAASVGNDP